MKDQWDSYKYLESSKVVADTYTELTKKFKEGSEEFNVEFSKQVEELHKKSEEGRNLSSLQYRGNMFWAGIKTQEDFDKLRHESAEDYRNGGFFLSRIGRYRAVDPLLTGTLLNLRETWIREYEVTTIPEFILVDMALASYFHFLRLNEAVNNLMASMEWGVFVSDFLHPSVTETTQRLIQVLGPVLEQYNRMFIRNLKAMRDLKRGNIQLNIGNIGQMNIADQQINVEKDS